MKPFLHRLTRAALLLAATATAAAHAGELTLYTHSNFAGPPLTLRGTTPDLEPLGFNDRTSSVIVRSGTWQLCEHANFQGRCMMVERGEYPALEGFNDAISSVREVSGRDGRDERGERDGRRGERDDDRGYGYGHRREAIVLFSKSRFGGAKLELHNNEVRTLERYDFNDQAGSVIVNEGRWELCEHADFGGRCIVLDPGRYERLDDMNNQISSLRRVR
ncbi:beta/gamma crystallin-related protein [Duganella violaceipulchra]|uniref:Beta/gamma crystallin family protein n=1 Tax=Duganella violaceipulchra TaxID=2849652 RepID=A0AA41L136_9BURK|nr:beta/gamma crystallin-related protein [Duganella violaceicalia]MBV6320083.1 beta/gamma crystallin family protein [Duganella violaceicalia]MCP2010450.1 hypothetical protein [Duganella violaceicalia]